MEINSAQAFEMATPRTPATGRTPHTFRTPVKAMTPQTSMDGLQTPAKAMTPQTSRDGLQAPLVSPKTPKRASAQVSGRTHSSHDSNKPTLEVTQLHAFIAHLQRQVTDLQAQIDVDPASQNHRMPVRNEAQPCPEPNPEDSEGESNLEKERCKSFSLTDSVGCSSDEEEAHAISSLTPMRRPKIPPLQLPHKGPLEKKLAIHAEASTESEEQLTCNADVQQERVDSRENTKATPGKERERSGEEQHAGEDDAAAGVQAPQNVEEHTKEACAQAGAEEACSEKTGSTIAETDDNSTAPLKDSLDDHTESGSEEIIEEFLYYSARGERSVASLVRAWESGTELLQQDGDVKAQASEKAALSARSMPPSESAALSARSTPPSELPALSARSILRKKRKLEDGPPGQNAVDECRVKKMPSPAIVHHADPSVEVPEATPRKVEAMHARARNKICEQLKKNDGKAVQEGKESTVASKAAEEFWRAAERSKQMKRDVDTQAMQDFDVFGDAVEDSKDFLIATTAEAWKHFGENLKDSIDARARATKAETMLWITDPHVQATCMSTIVGAMMLGTAWATFGLAIGIVVGGIAGIVPAVLTFGLSIPLAAALGGALCLCIGALLGGFLGSVVGGLAGHVGYKYMMQLRSRKEEGTQIHIMDLINDAKLQVLARFGNLLEKCIALACDPHVHAVCIGAALLGIAGGVFGLVVGIIVGGAAGLVPAILTLGVSIPVGAVIGGAVGASLGGTLGAVAGLVAGHMTYKYRLQIKDKFTQLRSMVLSVFRGIHTGTIDVITSTRTNIIQAVSKSKAQGLKSVDLAQARITQVKKTLKDLVCEPRIQAICIAASVGAISLGTAGGALGLAIGTLVGGVAGVLLAVFTFGLSIPVGAALGGAMGLWSGTIFVGAVGAVAGGLVGYIGYRHRVQVKHVLVELHKFKALPAQCVSIFNVAKRKITAVAGKVKAGACKVLGRSTGKVE